MTSNKMAALAARLGLAADDLLLQQALTHRSAGAVQNERLEFLGDRVLNLVVAAWLYQLTPTADEGTLSLRHTMLVRAECCAQVGESWNVWPLLQGQLAQATPAMRQRIVADAVEALLAVVYLRHGMAAVQPLVEEAWAHYMAALPATTKDAKTALQEHLQAAGLALPIYAEVAAEGPDHDRVFTTEVRCALGTARGQGPSKAAASMAAAAALLQYAVGDA
jgi:ribonuclease-3